MKIYTKKGDKGETSLFGGERVKKYDIRVEAYGTVDEVLAIIAFARSNVNTQKAKGYLFKIEKELFKLGAELACKNPEGILKERITDDDVKWLEEKIDELMEEIEFKKDFVIPGPYSSSSSLHIARTVARRAERCVVRLSEEQDIRPEIIRYLNRLSDFLFTLSLYQEKEEVIKKSLEEIKKKISCEVLNAMEQKEFPLSLDLNAALKMLKKAEEKAREINKPMCIAVVDSGGNLIAFHRMDEALLASIEIAINKAFTAVMLKMETSRLSELAKPEGELFGINNAWNGRIITFGGGIPVIKYEKVIGAIGVSGGTVNEDEIVAKAGISAI
ncbi:cob(I)yrinic acid a,c-diamide adenosyltransferase [Thermovenabulum sp.]|uniref:cob(I)yrinic acid a,c-diamide adenosyltransferase n=1 Tax=Thermovenabulum sp. TaxID=3100335 RepID=UPI003C79FF0D